MLNYGRMAQKEHNKKGGKSHIPSVKPPKAGMRWWVALIIALFSSITISIVVFVFATRIFVANDYSAPEDDTSEFIVEVLSHDLIAPNINLSAFIDEDSCEAIIDPAQMYVEALASTQVLNVLVPIILSGGSDSLEETNERLTRLANLGVSATIFVDAQKLENDAWEGLADNITSWQEDGHEIALEFFMPTNGDLEQMEMPDTDQWPYGTWLTWAHDQEQIIEDVCDCELTTWSGNISYSKIYDVMEELGFETHAGVAGTPIHGDWKKQGLGDMINLWTPAGGHDVESLLELDPEGETIFVPSSFVPCSDIGSHVILEEDQDFYNTYLYLSMIVGYAGNPNTLTLNLDQAFLDLTYGDKEAVEEGLFEWIETILLPLKNRGDLILSTYSDVTDSYQEFATQINDFDALLLDEEAL